VSRTAPPTSLARVEALCDLGRFDEAVREAGRHLRTDPHDVRALCVMAWAQLGVGNPAEALRAAGAAAAAAPFEEWPHRLASTALLRLGRPFEAVGAALAACRADPHGALPRVQLAEVVRAHGIDLPLARRAADEAVALDPHLVDAHLAVGSVALAQQRRGDAEAAFRAALRLDPDCAEAHHGLASLQVSGPNAGNVMQQAAAASGYATALRADPTAQQSRRAIDLVVFDVVRRTWYLVLLTGIMGMAIGGEANGWGPGVWLPVASMAVPFWLAFLFLRRLHPAVRAQLRGGLRRPGPRAAVTALGVAVVLVLVGAAVPGVQTLASLGITLVAIGFGVGLRRQGRRLRSV
jgi:tetratricopeptide (TPR) repeat protein